MTFDRLLTVNGDAKTKRSKTRGYLTAIQYFAPHTTAARFARREGLRVPFFTVCPRASDGCSSACLFTAGRARFDPSITAARVARTLLFWNDRDAYFTRLQKELEALKRRADRLGLKPCVRLNGTSDIQFEKITIDGRRTVFEYFPEVPFYDYTKLPGRDAPHNYSLTFSRSEDNEREAIAELTHGRNVAVVFDALPTSWNGFRVINGDAHDVRFTDPSPVVVGLKAKGDAKTDTTGFVIQTRTENDT